jgi:beta-N-acetylhexosaminidase
VRAAIASGEIPADQVEASLRRVEAARRRMAAVAQPPLSVVSSAGHKALAEQVAAAAVTVAKDDAGMLPLSRTGLGVVICRSTLLTEAEEAVASAPLMAQLVKSVLPEAEVLVVDRTPTPAQLGAVTALAKRSQGVIVGTYAAGRFPEQGALVKAALAANSRTVVLSQRDPYDLRALEGVGTYVVAYEDREHMLTAALKVIVGGMAATGKLPITL